MSERIRSRPYVWQPVAWSDQRVMTRGSVDGLPALTWGRADRAELATARQLRQLGLRPGGSAPVAVLVFGHRQPDGPRPAVEYASLYRIGEAAPKRTATPAQRAAIERALAARRTCQDCGQEQDYYLSTVSRRCGPCSGATDTRDDPAAEDEHDHEHDHADVVGDTDEWWVEHDRAVRAEDPHRPVTDTDVTDTDPAEHDGIDPAEHDGIDPAEPAPVAIPAQRRAEAGCRASARDTDRAEEARDAASDPSTPPEFEPHAPKFKSSKQLHAPKFTSSEPGRTADAPATRDDETARAVGRAQHALTRLAQQRARAARPEAAGADRARAGRLSQWHVDDRAAEQHNHDMEGLAR